MTLNDNEIIPDHPFLSGGGEMGNLIRSFNWSKNALGIPANWPAALKQTVNMMLTTPFPMLVCWGENHIQLYNDAFRPILGATKHPQALGISASETYAEIWDTIGPMFKSVLKGQPIGFPNFMVTMDRNGYPEECYFDFSYSPIRDEQAHIEGILVICIETTDKVRTLEELRRNQDALAKSEENFKNIILQAPVAMGLFIGNDMVLDVINNSFLKLWDRPGSIIGLPLHTALPELIDQPYLQIMRDVVSTGKTYYGNEAEVKLFRNGVLDVGYYNFINHPFRNNAGEITGVIVVANEVTDLVRDRHKVQVLNNELSAINNELHHTNQKLVVSNDELALIETNLQEVVFKLIDREARLQYMLSEAPVAIAIMTGPDLIIESANKKLLEAWGKDESIIGKPIHIALPELQGQQFLKLLDDVFTKGEPFYGNEVKALLEQNGQIEDVYSNFVYQPIKNDEGKTISIMLVANIVTEQVVARKKTEHAEQMMRFSIEAANLGTWDLDPKTYKFKGNARLKHWFGLAPDDEIELSKAIDIIIEKDRERVINAIQQAMTYESGGNYDIEYVIVNPADNIARFVRAQGQAIFDSEQHPLRFNGTLQDITEEKRGRQELERLYQQEKLSKEAAQLGTFDLDLVENVLEWDERCRTLFGISHNDPVDYDRDFLPGLHPHDRERVIDVISKSFTKRISNGDYDVEYRTVGVEDGKIRWVRAKGKVFFNEKDEPIRFIGSVLDITEQKQDDLRKNDFIGMVSHELKTPLTSLSAYTQILYTKAVKAEDKFATGALDKVNIQIRKMTNMINGFLNISRLESGKIEIIKSKFNIAELLSDVVKETEPTVVTHSIKLIPSDSITINADKDKIGSVVSNLLSNAIKYSPKGKHIEVTCERFGDTARVSVKDEGMGVKAHDIDKIFDRYYRVESNHTQHISGFGIGLYLSAEIIERHGGKIGVNSEHGKGSEFWFMLPIA
ncbi:PAS domain-containing protein [Mucilaginibacter sp. HMF5004]|uniref:PAS domain-containing sensor histidine kinase n=1 Tax=Mucilaginibacter rivuli TaxID=2857527 RepID=UPI001C5ED6F0|nr:ATP-binding protein [Mucilaginibacter rivuli]MBW4891534.1 PAS domain-containing protein [Mucilaginibacter rivuli]